MSRATRTAAVPAAVGLVGLLALAGAPATPAVASVAATVSTPGGIRSIDLGGTPVDPSTDPSEPTDLGPGLWADVLGPAGSADDTHQFSYRRALADSTVHVSVTASPDDPTGGGLELAVVTPDGESCGSETDTVSAPVPQSLLGVGVSVGPDEPGERDLCGSTSELAFSVTHLTSEERRAITVRVVEEAPVTSAAGLPEPPESPAFTLPQPADPDQVQPIAGAESFADAPELATGTTYADRLAEGAIALYRVRLDWGQSLAVRVDVPVMDDAALEALEFRRPNVALTLLDPLRAVVTGQVDDDETLEPYDDEEPAVLADGTAPVAYLNRFERLAATVPGDYWVSLAVQPGDPEAEPVEVPVELSVEVVGDPVEAPTYPANVVGPDGTVAPELYDAATPYLVSEEVFAADVTGDPVSADLDEEGLPVRLGAGLALGVVSVLCVVVGVRLLRRRRSA